MTAPTTAALATGDGPGETAAPTTAALAIGDGPGPMAAPTTAAFATGPPMTPTPRRPGPRGMSDSLCFEGHVGFDGGDDGLDRDPAVGDELATRPAHGRGKRRRPHVLVDEGRAHAPRLHRGRQVVHVGLGQGLDQLRLEAGEVAQLVEVAHLLGHDRPVR